MFTLRWEASAARTVVVLLLLLALAAGTSPVQASGIEAASQQQVRPGVSFEVDDTGVCIVEPRWIDATLRVTLPEGVTAHLQVSYHMIHPVYSDIHYIDVGTMKNGDRYTFQAYWPGIQPGDKMVEIHWGASLRDVKTGKMIATGGLDYFWYPYICDPHKSVTPTPRPTSTAQPARTPQVDPGTGSSLPTFAPPQDPRVDVYAVLPITGADLRADASRSMGRSLVILIAGMGVLTLALRRRRR